MNEVVEQKTSLARGTILVIALCLPYIVSQFLRSSVGVIGPNLVEEIHLDPAELGFLASIFFLSFAFAQIPLGAAIDRFGAKICLLSSVGVAVLGCFLFSWAQTSLDLMLSRLVMGLGCATFFMAPLAIYTRWFSRTMFSSLTGITLGIGTLGTLLATAPMAQAVALVGWRAVFIYMALAALFFAVIILFVVRDAPPGRPAISDRPTSFVHSLLGFRTIVVVPGVWNIFIMQAVMYGIFASLLGLWVGPYLSDVHGLGLEARGQVMFVMAATQVIGLFIWGPSDRLFSSRKIPAMIGAFAVIAALTALALIEIPSLTLVTIIFGAIGFFSACMPVVLAHGRDLFALNLVGRGITLLNIGTMGGAFALQAASGYFITSLSNDSLAGKLDASAYQATFGAFALILTGAALFYLKSPPSSAR